MTGSIAPNCPGHHGTVVARTVGTVAISCNVYIYIYTHTHKCTIRMIKVLRYSVPIGFWRNKNNLLQFTGSIISYIRMGIYGNKTNN